MRVRLEIEYIKYIILKMLQWNERMQHPDFAGLFYLYSQISKNWILKIIKSNSNKLNSVLYTCCDDTGTSDKKSALLGRSNVPEALYTVQCLVIDHVKQLYKQ